jgi:hypothetical protein
MLRNLCLAVSVKILNASASAAPSSVGLLLIRRKSWAQCKAPLSRLVLRMPKLILLAAVVLSPNCFDKNDASLMVRDNGSMCDANPSAEMAVRSTLLINPQQPKIVSISAASTATRAAAAAAMAAASAIGFVELHLLAYFKLHLLE